MRWLIIAVAAFILYKIVVNTLRKRAAGHTTKEWKTPADDLVKDPVCGAYVAAGTSISVRDGATVYRFCSHECRDAFLAQLRASGRHIPETPHTTAPED